MYPIVILCLVSFCLTQSLWVNKQQTNPYQTASDTLNAQSHVDNSRYIAYLEKDLEFIYQHMKDKTTSSWLTKGLRDSIAKASSITSDNYYVSILQKYINGFASPYHILASASPLDFNTPGFLIRKQGQEFIVTWHDMQATTQLPPLGARIINLNGQPVEKVYTQMTLPFINAAAPEAATFTLVNAQESSLHSCEFQYEGKRYSISLRSYPIGSAQLYDAFEHIYGNNISLYAQAYLQEPRTSQLAQASRHALPSKLAVLYVLSNNFKQNAA